MTNEQAQKMWREAKTIWKASKPSESWLDAWKRLFSSTHKYPNDDLYEDGEGGRLRVGEHPLRPGLALIFVRVEPADKQEIRQTPPREEG